jgi:excisionase family DNA binding protein
MPKNKTPINLEAAAIMTVHDVADYLRLSEAKVYRLANDNLIPVVRIGKTWRFRRGMIDEWMRQCTEAGMKSTDKKLE